MREKKRKAKKQKVDCKVCRPYRVDLGQQYNNNSVA